MRLLMASLLVGMLGLASAAVARETCTPCDNGRRYCGEYDSRSGTWIRGDWETCSGSGSGPSCQNEPGRSSLKRKYQSDTICRPVRRGSNECIRAGTANVAISVFTCEYNNFDGCGKFIGTYEEQCGSEYSHCGC